MMSSAQLGNRLVAANESACAAKAVAGSPPSDHRTVGIRPGAVVAAPVPPALLPPTASAPQGLPAAAPETALPSALQVSRAGKLAAVAIVTLLVIAGLGWLGQRSDPAIPQRTAVVRVGAGETIWDVAARVAPQSEQRAVVDRIRNLNHLTDSKVVPDQQLQVPDGR
jgi:hypothetical protein